MILPLDIPPIQQEPEILRAKRAALVAGDWCIGCGGAKEAGVELCVNCRPVLSHQTHMLLLVSAALESARAAAVRATP